MDDFTGITVTSSPDAEGTYHLVLELGPDVVIPLSAPEALNWVAHLAAAAATAEHEAALVRAVRAVGMTGEVLGELIRRLRQTRQERNRVPESPLGLHLTPGVSAFTGKGFLQLHHNKVLLGQWNPEDARTHAVSMLMAVATLDLDTDLYRTLTTVFDVPGAVALNLINDLSNHRE